ncbi:hypothetical protein [Sporosarcina koreensis]|uniref:hypothetical protein n=1 Tax=Sporosarcina koreensis TaxID=334735 RepID=UPI000694210E|nr:hypothetical protein [Sporosarcina koreensis]
MNLKCAAYLFILVSLLSLLAACTSSGKDWNSSFIVWHGDMYEVGSETIQEVEEKLGQVTVYSDREATYIGTFSNQYRKGTKFFAIPGESPDDMIAVEEEGAYRKAVNTGKYGRK